MKKTLTIAGILLFVFLPFSCSNTGLDSSYYDSSSSNNITSFTIDSYYIQSQINNSESTIKVIINHGVSKSSLLPRITHTGASISPESGIAQDFANPIQYTVTAANGSKKVYIVTIVAAPQVSIYSVITTPTTSECVTLKNNSVLSSNISNWKLGDLNNPTAYNIPNGTMLAASAYKSFQHTTLGFQINDSGERIYLYDNIGVLRDSWP